ncbi:MAG: MFS transporter [Eubacteriales bacterium]|nr:MFS transporter [Eubacteriales bacterium]
MFKGRYLAIIAAGCILSFSLGLGTTCLGFFVGPVTAALGLSVTKFVTHISVLTTFSIVGFSIAGFLVQKLGLKKLVILNGIVSGGCIALFSQCKSIFAFYVLSAIIGLLFFPGSSYVIPIMLSKWFIKSRGKVMGFCFAFSGVCGTVMGLIIPPIISSAGWKIGYLVLGAFEAGLLIITGLFLIKDSPEDCGMKPYGWEEQTAASNSGTTKGAIKEEVSYTMKELTRTWQFWGLALAIVLINVMASITSHYSNHYTIQGLNAEQAGYLVSLLSLVMIFTKIAEGAVSDKIGPTKTMAVCMITYCIGFLLLTRTSFGILAAGAAILSIGAASVTVMIPLLTQMSVGPKHYASIWAIISIVNSLGTVIGNLVYGFVVDAAGNYLPILYANAGISILCAVLFSVPVTSLKKKRDAEAIG